MKTEAYRLVAMPAEHNLSERFFGRFRRVGLRGVLDDSNRRGSAVEVPGVAALGGMAWAAAEQKTRRWYPQGITTSADAYGSETDGGSFEGKPVLITSWYGHGAIGYLLLGSRISIIDYSDPEAPRYRHVLLVAPERRFGIHRLRPVRVHAGGIVWYGKYLYVAGTAEGIRVFRLDDIVRVHNRARTKGYRYVLPQFTSYAAQNDADAEPMKYSFMSLDRTDAEDSLVAGEYGRKGGSHRLISYALDRTTELPRTNERGHAIPSIAFDRQVERMQGAALVNGVWVLTASRGEGNPGDLWIGQPGEFTLYKGVLPTGPEDITYWPQRGQLWSVTEWPQRRWVYAIDAHKWAGTVSAPD